MATHDEMKLLSALKTEHKGDANFKVWFEEVLCRREADIGEEFKCAWCGELSVRTRKDKKFCTDKCRNDFHRLAPEVLKKLELEGKIR